MRRTAVDLTETRRIFPRVALIATIRRRIEDAECKTECGMQNKHWPARAHALVARVKRDRDRESIRERQRANRRQASMQPESASSRSILPSEFTKTDPRIQRHGPLPPFFRLHHEPGLDRHRHNLYRRLSGRAHSDR